MPYTWTFTEILTSFAEVKYGISEIIVSEKYLVKIWLCSFLKWVSCLDKTLSLSNSTFGCFNCILDSVQVREELQAVWPYCSLTSNTSTHRIKQRIADIPHISSCLDFITSYAAIMLCTITSLWAIVSIIHKNYFRGKYTLFAQLCVMFPYSEWM